MTVFWVLLVVYTFGLPLWSYIFTDKLGYGAQLCTMDAELVTCGGGVDYVDMAKRLGRTRPDGTLWGCSCGEGVFGDWACSRAESPSLSFFVGVGPATGGLTLFTAFPNLFIWFYGAGNTRLMAGNVKGSSMADKQFYLDFITVSQILFQIFYGVFLFASVCVFPALHQYVTYAFIACEVIHFIAIARSCDATRRQAVVIRVIIYGGLVLTVAFILVPVVPGTNGLSIFTRYAFFIGECIGICVIASVPVVMAWAAALAGDAPEAEREPLTEPAAEQLAAEKAERGDGA